MPLVWVLVAWLVLGLLVGVIVGPALRRAAPPLTPAARSPQRSQGGRPAA